MIEEQGKVILGEYVNIIQHPGGEPKQLALRENQIINLLEDFIHYQTDTAPGSSGSPVFNDQWEVAALHHSGVPRMDEQGNLLAIDGSIWTEAMGEERLDWIGNEGVRISRIIQDIKQRQNLTPVQRQLRSQLFDGSQPTLSTSVSNRKNIVESSTTVIPDKQVDSGVVTWTIPLKVSVGLGTLGLPVSPPATASGTNDSELPAIEDELPSIDRDPEIQAEIKQLKLLE